MVINSSMYRCGINCKCIQTEGLDKGIGAIDNPGFDTMIDFSEKWIVADEIKRPLWKNKA